jgi:succinate-semialdehyde dehydrogenase/glutarate-semialdehyde dehydrogenase
MPATAEASPIAEEQIWSPRVSGAMLARLAERADVPATRDPLPVEAPFSGTTLAPVPRGTPDDMRGACRAAREAQREWARTAVVERARILLAFHDLLIANADEILDIIQLESGKARRHALEEVLDTAVTARYYAHAAADLLRPRRRQGALPVLTQTFEYHHPKGVVGFVTPWNYPLILGISDALPALAAGNGAVIKPDAMTPSPRCGQRGFLRKPVCRAACCRSSPDAAQSLGRRSSRRSTASCSPAAPRPASRSPAWPPSASSTTRSSWAARTP